MHRALCQIKISSINSAIATKRYITVSVCSLQHSHNYFTTKYPQVVLCNTPTGCLQQHTHIMFTTIYPQVVQYLEHTHTFSLQHTHNFHCNTPTGCSVQHTHKFFTATHPPVVHCNIHTRCWLQHTRNWFTIHYTHMWLPPTHKLLSVEKKKYNFFFSFLFL